MNAKPDPQAAEAQIYTRIETARTKLFGMINQILKETGLPTAIVLELLRGMIAETTLALERTAHGATLKDLVELREAAKKAEEKAEK